MKVIGLLALMVTFTGCASIIGAADRSVIQQNSERGRSASGSSSSASSTSGSMTAGAGASLLRGVSK